MKTVRMNVKEAVKDCTLNIKITGKRVLTVRLKIGCWLIKLGCKVIGCKICISDDWDKEGASNETK